jgi:hypothetical protein
MAFGKPTDEDIYRKFDYHVPFGDQTERYQKIRQTLAETAKVIRDLTPCSPEQTRAINALHEAMMLANAAIAINEKPE